MTSAVHAGEGLKHATGSCQLPILPRKLNRPKRAARSHCDIIRFRDNYMQHKSSGLIVVTVVVLIMSARCDARSFSHGFSGVSIPRQFAKKFRRAVQRSTWSQGRPRSYRGAGHVGVGLTGVEDRWIRTEVVMQGVLTVSGEHDARFGRRDGPRCQWARVTANNRGRYQSDANPITATVAFQSSASLKATSVSLLLPGTGAPFHNLRSFLLPTALRVLYFKLFPGGKTGRD